MISMLFKMLCGVRSAVVVVEARAGRQGGWRWFGLDEFGSIRARDNSVVGVANEDTALNEGRAVFPFSKIRNSQGQWNPESAPEPESDEAPDS